MATVSRTPWMGTLTLTTGGTKYQLSALLAANANPPFFKANPIAQYLSIQADPSGGGAKFYIGNENMTTSNYGVQLVATQAYPIYSMSSNLINLDQVWIICDTSSESINVSFIMR